ncbi:uncharacterized protein M421DRAFT_427231 [Didymella exigua CBS 183.55]|uniref:Uncharacterized protein n=1 Tax=Didymella exigua CBS 183.55 TaxID=1150837 RepID=A0A6A5R384_9PLEO|nr:uncharacterized protein M421DRAFT_427231 [Didymella exigua CBS 183.55]KAF1922142.1 hypothetical protein M421DRAFT_427231 [Didymella exigua CBS 183.55]
MQHATHPARSSLNSCSTCPHSRPCLCCSSSHGRTPSPHRSQPAAPSKSLQLTPIRSMYRLISSRRQPLPTMKSPIADTSMLSDCTASVCSTSPCPTSITESTASPALPPRPLSCA